MTLMSEGESDLAFAQSLIVELQHVVRDLRHALENERVVVADLRRRLALYEEVRSPARVAVTPRSPLRLP